MPTATGAETIGERLTRLRAELARVRATIQRSKTSVCSRSQSLRAGLKSAILPFSCMTIGLDARPVIDKAVETAVQREPESGV